MLGWIATHLALLFIVVVACRVADEANLTRCKSSCWEGCGRLWNIALADRAIVEQQTIIDLVLDEDASHGRVAQRRDLLADGQPELCGHRILA